MPDSQEYNSGSHGCTILLGARVKWIYRGEPHRGIVVQVDTTDHRLFVASDISGQIYVDKLTEFQLEQLPETESPIDGPYRRSKAF